MSCWHKLFCKRESVSNDVSVFVLISKLHFVQVVWPLEEYGLQEKQSLGNKHLFY